jgi:dihydrofolate synthase/folylpolyglutamate synthase
MTVVDSVLERLTRLHPKVIDLSLERVERLLAALGDPQDRLPPVIHVAGTNGKGSVVAYLRAIFEAAGYRAHVYTSPHLVRFAERIRVAGTIIDDDALTALLEDCERANAGQPITFFEITTAAAFLAFSRTPADVVLLETGLGGRLDATNVVKAPALTAITPISMDHEQFLGGTLESIASEKACIMKPGVACVVADQERKVNKVLELWSLQKGVALLKEGEHWFARSQGGSLIYQGGAATLTLPPPALPGAHQMRNAGLAIACVERLSRVEPTRFTIPDAAIALGLRTVEWPARLQRLKSGPLVDALPEGWELWLDGGHNEAAGRMLGLHARGWRDKPLHVVFGMINSKKPGKFIKPLAPRIGRLRAVAIPGEANALPAAELAAAAKAEGVWEAETAESVEAALADILAKEAAPARVLICGSLYLAGTVLVGNG